MFDDSRSNMSKPRKVRPRILVVQNGGAESDSSSGDEHISQAFESSLGNYQPPAQSVSYADRHPSPHHPTPLTTRDLPNHRNYPSSRSNPALSSPSSTSSPAVESTPPPSTPGQCNPPDLSSEGTGVGSNEGTLMQEPVMVSYPDPDESASQPPNRTLQSALLNRLRIAPRPTHGRRSSNTQANSVSSSCSLWPPEMNHASAVPNDCRPRLVLLTSQCKPCKPRRTHYPVGNHRCRAPRNRRHYRCPEPSLHPRAHIYQSEFCQPLPRSVADLAMPDSCKYQMRISRTTPSTRQR